MDAKADHRFSIADWPTEGTSLAEAIERIAGPELLAECLAARAAVPYSWAFEKDRVWPVWWLDKSGEYQSQKATVILVKRAKELTRTCLAPVIDAWDSGAVSVTGRRRDMLAAAVEIPAPASLWTVSVVDLERSIIEDPVSGKIFDLRFKVEAQSAGLSKASIRWLQRAVADLKHSTGTPPKNRTRAARRLRTQMVKDVQQGKVKNALGERTIVNYLRTYDLWP